MFGLPFSGPWKFDLLFHFGFLWWFRLLGFFRKPLTLLEIFVIPLTRSLSRKAMFLGKLRIFTCLLEEVCLRTATGRHGQTIGKCRETTETRMEFFTMR